MSVVIKTLTAEELWAMPQHGGRNELVNGELRPMPPTGSEHGGVIFELGRLLGNHVVEHKLGRVFAAETGFVIKQNPDTMLAADVTFVSAAHTTRGSAQEFLAAGARPGGGSGIAGGHI